MQITPRLVELVEQVISLLKLPKCDVKFDHPKLESHGDYATNIALLIFPKLSVLNKNRYQNPKKLAETIADEISLRLSDVAGVMKPTVAGSGFINFKLTDELIVKSLDHILLSGKNYGKTNRLVDKKVVVEYTDPNPFKELHLGHLYSNLIGEAISKLYENAGAKVWRTDYYGDVGLHVAKAIFGIITLLHEQKLGVDQVKNKSKSDRQNILGKGYALGVRKYEESELAKQEIKKLNSLLYVIAQEIHKEKGWHPKVDYQKFIPSSNFNKAEIREVYQYGLAWSLEYFEEIYHRLGTKFDGYYPESLMGEYGYELVMEGLKKGVFVKSEEAVIFKGEKYGLHTRVFINKNGLPTYEAKEIGLAPAKYKDFKYDLSVIVVGMEIKEYFKVLLTALKLINPKLGKGTRVLNHGMVKLPEGKMASRLGNVVTVEELINKSVNKSKSIITSAELTEGEKNNIADKVGLAAIKFALLKTSTGNDVVFDDKESISFSGKSGPYLQYTVARCNSVIAKVGIGVNLNIIPVTNEEMALNKWLLWYEEKLTQSLEELSLHYLCDYLYELAQRYNTFYTKQLIKGNEYRIKLTKATKLVLTNGLEILGITCPEKM